MLQIPKKVEYALIAIRHMAIQPNNPVVTAKEVADRYHIPYEVMAKVMQKLTKVGLVFSHQGVHGGYTLARRPSEIRISEVFEALEGKPSVALIQCEAESPENCSIHTTCTIKDPLVRIQDGINSIFQHMTVSEMV
jgi:Rrf2 family protein